MNEEILKKYCEDDIKASDAKIEALKLSFAPIAFQVAKSMIDLKIFNVIEDAKEDGISEEEIVNTLNLNKYIVSTLIELSLSIGLVKIKKDSNPYKYTMSKIGYFIMNDALIKVNMNFTHDVCYQGLFHLTDSLLNGKPEGLKAFGPWKTIYEGLSFLPEHVKKSWFGFNHYYSDNAFDEIISIVFKKKRKKIMEIGCNIGKFAKSVLSYDEDVSVTLVDLSSQIEMAKNNMEGCSFEKRISYYPTNILDANEKLPNDVDVDVVWMSQFLDCFSLCEIKFIMQKVKDNVSSNCDIFILEPLWDKQKFLAGYYSIQATSVYFATMANGNSKMYSYDDLVGAVKSVGYNLINEYHECGKNNHSLLHFKGRA